MLALYLTIWLSLALFVAGETGRSSRRRESAAPAWAWWSFALGLVLSLVHTILAFALVHNWVHDAAVLATAQQTQAMFRVRVGWGVYVNYAFFVVWLADVCWWRLSPDLSRRPPAVTWTLRAFYMLIIFNGAVVFAAGARRMLGLLLVLSLAGIWGRGIRAQPLRSHFPH